MNKTLLTNYPLLSTPLKAILKAIHLTAVEIENHVRYSTLKGLHSDHNGKNTSGDVQKKLDVIANDAMIHYLTESNACNILLSEENKDHISVPKNKRGPYLVAFDPLDGSSNIDCNAPIGTIFSISENKKEQILLNGKNILIAGYVLYGPATELVIAINNKVDRYVMDNTNNFIYVGQIKLGSKKIYSINESNSNAWGPDMKKYIENYKGTTAYTARYIGSMVGDVHRTLLYGGMFSYPSDKKNPQGKLRLLYECYPMAKIMECAGGKAIVGHISKQRILEVEPKNIHQKSPILLGTVEEVNKYETVLALIPSKL